MLQFLLPFSQVGPAERLIGARDYMARGMSFESILTVVIVSTLISIFVTFIFLAYIKEKKKHSSYKRGQY